MSDLGLMNYFLGLEVKQDEYGIHISQRKNTKDLLKDFNMLYCKAVPTPLNASIMQLQANDDSRLENATRYRRLIK